MFDCVAQSLEDLLARFPSCTLVSLVVIALMSVFENIAQIRQQIQSAALRANRNPEDIILMAVTKTVAPPPIREAYAAGIRIFGENRVQEFSAKAEALRDLPDAEWHMIGHLQSNKSAKAAECFAHIDSVDSLRLAQKLNSAAAERGKRLPVLVEINTGGESAKHGLAPGADGLEELLAAAPELSSLEIRGLMTVPPYDEDPERSRPYFQSMRMLFENIGARQLPAVKMVELSMGMSHDFEIAVEEGATCVRLGTAIFGARPPLRSTI